MDRRGNWSLAPAYDMTFSYNPNSIWTSAHQMTINGKRENLTIEDLKICGKNMNLSERKINTILQQVIAVVREWAQYAEYVGLSEESMEYIKKYHMYSKEYDGYIPNIEVLNKAKECNHNAYIQF